LNELQVIPYLSKEHIKNAVKVIVEGLDLVPGMLLNVCYVKNEGRYFADAVVDEIRSKNKKIIIDRFGLYRYGFSNDKFEEFDYENKLVVDSIADAYTLVVDGVCDSGRNLKYIVDTLKSMVTSNKIVNLVMLNKSNGAKVFNPDFYCFEVDDRYFVGYGLEYEGLYGGLDFVGIVDLPVSEAVSIPPKSGRAVKAKVKGVKKVVPRVEE
jgi:hypoxanthine phosphoribosyltransferase